MTLCNRKVFKLSFNMVFKMCQYEFVKVFHFQGVAMQLLCHSELSELFICCGWLPG